MIKVSVIAKTHYNINIDVNSFEDICFENMSREDSDELVMNAIHEQYGDIVDDIISVNINKD